eukprot:TRINITY_DN11385_c0_g2_i2.p1 TRINITY_DN11385_c0_g2~~TRINITY_DN11385_c0_g2_i2.p1  ORF type:complete len:380 (+),score=46.20 TRINITY_DN11385_c0_g2_i2:57-1142(+)
MAATKSLERLQDFNHTELAVVVWALSSLDSDNKPVTHFLLAAKDLVLAQLQNYTFTDLSTILYSLANSKLKKQDIKPLFQKLVAFEHLIPELPPNKVCGAVIALNAYAKTYKENYGKVPYTVRTGVGRFVMLIGRNQKYLTQKDVVMTAWGLGVFRLGHVKLVDVIRKRIQKNLHSFDLYDSSNLFWAMGALKKDNRGLVPLHVQKKRVQCCQLLFEHIIQLLQRNSQKILQHSKQNKKKQKQNNVQVNQLLVKINDNSSIENDINNSNNVQQNSDIQTVDVRWITQIFHTSTQLNIITPQQFLQLVELCSGFVKHDVFAMDTFLSNILIRSYTILKSSCDPTTKMRVDQSLFMKQAISKM